jgi:hypothetical protein
MLLIPQRAVEPTRYAVECQHGNRRVNGSGTPAFKISVSGEEHLERVSSVDGYSAAITFVQGEISISGDIPVVLGKQPLDDEGIARVTR